MGLVAASLAAGLFAAGRSSLPRDPGRDVLLITIDTLRADALGSYGNRAGTSPVIDRLAAEGVRFESAHAHNVVTLPSHANILSGQLPFEHGVRGNAGFRFPAHAETLATLLEAQGYRTGAFVSGFPLDSRFGLDRGFETYDDRFAGGHTPHSFVVPERSAVATVAAAERWLAADDPRPALCWVHLYDPHTPYRPPEPYASRFRAEPYLGEVAATDAALSRLLEPGGPAAIRRRLVVLTSDHGEGLGEHGEATHGLFAYESTLHVPLVLHAPGLLDPHVVEDAVGHVDLLPTILDLLALPIPEGLSGRSLLPLALARPAPPVPTYFEALSGMLERGWAPLYGVIDEGGHKYIELPLPELYELDRDPDELINRAAERAAILADLSGTLGRLRAADVGVTRDEESAQTRARLEALGYLASAKAPIKAEYGPEDDPKRLVELDGLLQRVIALHRAGDLAEAVRVCQELVRRRPQMGISWIQLAMLQRRLGRIEKAVQEARQAFEHNPDDEGPAVLLAGYLSEAGEAGEAADLLQPYAESSDASLDMLTTFGVALARSGRGPEALVAFERARQLDPSVSMTYVQIATLHLGLGRPAEARRALEAALEVGGELALAHHTLGLIALGEGNRAEAENRFRRALEIEPEEHDALLNLGTLLARSGRIREARPLLERFVAAAPRPLYDVQIARIQRWLRRNS